MGLLTTFLLGCFLKPWELWSLTNDLLSFLTSSGWWAKKHTFLLQPGPCLQSSVLNLKQINRYNPTHLLRLKLHVFLVTSFQKINHHSTVLHFKVHEHKIITVIKHSLLLSQRAVAFVNLVWQCLLFQKQVSSNLEWGWCNKSQINLYTDLLGWSQYSKSLCAYLHDSPRGHGCPWMHHSHNSQENFIYFYPFPHQG